MTNSIHFPNLGIHLKNVGQSINIFGLDIAFYGMIIGIGMLLGILLGVKEAKRTGQNPEFYYDLALYAIPLSVVGARLFYVIFKWDDYKGDLLSVFNIRQGGLAIYGGVLAAVLTVVIYGRIKKVSFWLIADTAVLGLITGQIIGRWGNFFNREAFGEYTDSLLAMRLPINAVDSENVTKLMYDNKVIADGITYIQVHPTFLYESLWNLGVLLVLLWWRKRKKFEGEVFLMYLFGYGVGRSLIEGLRTDQLLIPWVKLPVSQVLAVFFVFLSGGLIFWKRKKINEKVQE